MSQIQSCITSLLLLCASYPFLSQATVSSKRGLAYSSDDHLADLRLLLSAKSPTSWYYTWSLYETTSVNETVPFVPLIHGTDEASNSDLTSILDALPSSSTHLLTFNEPDGTTSSGGSSIEPDAAARAYMDYVVPLQSSDSDSRTWKISHPAVTGSTQGLDWLRRFNASCYELDAARGCPTDFVAVHWYGDFGGLQWWLGTLRDFYANDTAVDVDDLAFWVTEMALAQADEDTTVDMLNQTLPYLDGLDYVEAYAWFGAFREDDANGWTGSEVSFFDDDGGLTEVGSLYLGGEKNGFAVGTQGEGNAGARPVVSHWSIWLAGLVVATTLL